MKNKYLAVSALLLCILAAGGCDMFRSMAGRPTSADLEEIRVELARREAAAEQARLDSIARVKKAREDSLARAAALDTLQKMKGVMRTPARFGGLASGAALDSTYYIVLASFRDHSNAERFSEKMATNGYASAIIPFRNGFNSLGLSPTTSPVVLLSELRRLRKESFCPKDIWILVNEKTDE